MARRAPRLGLFVAAVGLGAALGLGAAPGSASACDPVPVPFQRVVERAEQVYLVTIAQRSMAGSVPQSYTLVVREVLRGELPDDVTLPTTVTIAAPVLDACGTVLDERITRHLVLALDVQAFDVGAPVTVAWRLLPDGRLEKRTDDGPATWADLDAFKAALAGAVVASAEPSPVPAPSAVVAEPDGVPVASIGIIASLGIGVIAGVLVIITGRRAARPPRPRPPSAG